MYLKITHTHTYIYCIWSPKQNPRAPKVLEKQHRNLVAKVGQPHQWALEEQKRLIKEKAEAAKASGMENGSEGVGVDETPWGYILILMEHV